MPPALNEANLYTIILGSGSPRRRELLERLGLNFTVVLPDDRLNESNGGINETPLPNEAPPDLVRRLSQTKARVVLEQLTSQPLPNANPPPSHIQTHKEIIIAADTVVVSTGQILGKPTGRDQAKQMLQQLRQDQPHNVYSGLTVAVRHRELTKTNPLIEQQPATSGTHFFTRLNQSKVWMRPYTDAEIEAYLDSGDPLDKAGAYAIQNKDFAPVECLEGCFASVVGLPLGDLAAILAEIGCLLPEIAPHCAGYSDYPCCQQK